MSGQAKKRPSYLLTASTNPLDKKTGNSPGMPLRTSGNHAKIARLLVNLMPDKPSGDDNSMYVFVKNGIKVTL